MATEGIASLRDWIGRTSEAEDIVTPRLLDSFQAMLTPHVAATDPDAAPLGLHWCLAPAVASAAELGPDGHPARGGFLPPVPLPRRMWAGSEVRFIAPLRLGAVVRRRSTVTGIEEKHGRTGTLVFVTVGHQWSSGAETSIEESQIIVYREAATPGTQPASPTPTASEAAHRREVAVDPVLLFRYSALTFNGHRIHYDAPYATQVEHYPGLVIHGPLQATLLLNFAAAIEERPPTFFSFRGVQPATGAQRLSLEATPSGDGGIALEVRAEDGTVTMKATARF